MSHEVDPRLWRSFLVTADELHFGRAADRLFIAQSALSQRIQRLETQIGVALFERSTRRVALTSAGRELQRRVGVALPLLDDALEAARAVAGGRGAELAVGIDAACREHITPALAKAFAHADHGASVRWHEASSGDLADELLARRLEIAVVHSARAANGLTLVPFFDDVLVAQLSAGANGSVDGSIALAELDGLTVLLAGPGNEGHDRRCLALLGGAGLRPRTGVRGYGATDVPPGHVAITSRALVAPTGRCAVIRPDQVVRFSFMLREHGVSPAVEAFIERAREVRAAHAWGSGRPPGRAGARGFGL